MAEAAQGADGLERVQPEPAQQLNGQIPGDEAAVEQVDRPGARRDVQPAGAYVGFERLWRSDIAAQLHGVSHAVGNEGRIAQAEVEALVRRWEE